jgi:hypothetical protein
MDKIVSKTKYDRKQHKKYYLFHMFHRNKSTYFVIFVSIGAIALALWNTINMKGNPSGVLMLWALAAFTVMVTPLLMISKINGIVRNETQERKESTDTIEVTKVKISRSNTAAEGKAVIGWTQVDCICETKDFIYIYTGPQTGIFIVKKDIIEGDVELFRKIAENNMRKNRKGKAKYKKYFKENK